MLDSWLWLVHSMRADRIASLHQQGVADVPIYGRIATLQLFRPPVREPWAGFAFCVLISSAGGCGALSSKCATSPHDQHRHVILSWTQGEDKDLIFLSTERYMFCVLAWDTEKGAQPAHKPPPPVLSQRDGHFPQHDRQRSRHSPNATGAASSAFRRPPKYPTATR